MRSASNDLVFVSTHDRTNSGADSAAMGSNFQRFREIFHSITGTPNAAFE
jgi:hypothetical protein